MKGEEANMRSCHRVSLLGLVLLAFLAFGCGGAGLGKGAKQGVTVGPDGERIISKEARRDFKDAAEKYQSSLEKGLDKRSCKRVVKEFEDVADDNNNMAEALYNVGAVYRKCGMKDKAESAFKKTLKVDPNNQLSLTHLAVMELERGNEPAAEELLRKAVGAGKNKLEAVPAYVNASIILRKRGFEKKSDEEFKKAQMNLRRALAIDAKYMPALYQLAMLYHDIAIMNKKASYFTLAKLVCNQAIALDPEYGPTYHALGQILLQQNELVKALQAFKTAHSKDPKLVGSLMNYAAINLNFRGYEEAKAAFEQALTLRPNSYDAHIGLGVALRGMGDFAGARAEYKKAAGIDSKRTDYIFNIGLLEMDYENPGTVAGYNKAKGVFQQFVSKATRGHRVDPDGKGPERSWYDKAKDRIERCDDNMKKIREAEKEMAELEKMAKEQAKRQAEMQRKIEKAKKLEEKEAAGEKAPDGAKEADGKE